MIVFFLVHFGERGFSFCLCYCCSILLLLFFFDIHRSFSSPPPFLQLEAELK